jgi:general secretion pathway protein G
MRHDLRLPRSARGFTLLEVMVVLLIIGMFVGMVAVNIGSRVDQAATTKAAADIQTLDSALELYKLDNFQYPTSEQGLRALVERPRVPPEPRNWRQYVKRLPDDPWQRPYQYVSPGQRGEFDVFTLGADGKVGGEGKDADIGNWDPARP